MSLPKVQACAAFAVNQLLEKWARSSLRSNRGVEDPAIATPTVV